MRSLKLNRNQNDSNDNNDDVGSILLHKFILHCKWHFIAVAAAAAATAVPMQSFNRCACCVPMYLGECILGWKCVDAHVCSLLMRLQCCSGNLVLPFLGRKSYLHTYRHAKMLAFRHIRKMRSSDNANETEQIERRSYMHTQSWHNQIHIHEPAHQ